MQTKLIILFLGLYAACFSQTKFRLNSTLGKKPVKIIINSVAYSIDSTYKDIRTNYPRFDTLTFVYESERPQYPIICNFRPDLSYSLIISCCGSIDIVLSKKINKVNSLKLDFEKDFDRSSEKSQLILQDRPTFTFRIINATKTDSIYGWYADYSCLAKFKLLDNNDWFYGEAQKCYYWNNISLFQFFKSPQNYSKDINKQNEIEYVYPEPENINVLAFINIRLFDNNKYLLTYDNKDKSIKLERAK